MIIERRMTRNPVTATPEMTITEAASIMKQEKVHRLPVLDKEHRLIGIISEKDILRSSPSSANTLSVHEMSFLLSKLPVKKVMSKNPVIIKKDATVEEAARIMVDQDISCLPVIEDKKLIGIVTKTDLFKLLLELFGARHYGVRVTFLVEDKPGTIATISKAFSECGIDIIAMGTFMGTDASNALCTIKLQNCSMTQAIDIIKPYVLQVIDVREI